METKPIDMLTPDSVSILTRKTAMIDGVAYTLGNHRRAYINDTAGRAAIAAEQPADVAAAVMAMWGDAPTVPDPEPEAAPDNQ